MKNGAFRESNLGPLAPKARIIQLGQMPFFVYVNCLQQGYCRQPLLSIYSRLYLYSTFGTSPILCIYNNVCFDHGIVQKG